MNQRIAAAPGRTKRREQLRLAKRAQRRRERRAGLAHVQLTLPRALVPKLLRASRDERFSEDLAHFLDEALVPLADYPALRDIAWNRAETLIPAREAFQLYERNWRFVDPVRVEPRERALIERLAARYGPDCARALGVEDTARLRKGLALLRTFKAHEARSQTRKRKSGAKAVPQR